MEHAGLWGPWMLLLMLATAVVWAVMVAASVGALVQHWLRRPGAGQRPALPAGIPAASASGAPLRVALRRGLLRWRGR